MARQREEPPDTTGKVPLWFLTYSDVITLLMTFFILLLTFATDEPEKFGQLQISLFGGTGATGVAGDPEGPMKLDAFVMRTRPYSGRVTLRGSEMPPTDSEATLESLSEGLTGLDEEKWNPTESYDVETQLSMLITDQAEVTSYGRQSMKMLSRQMQKDPYSIVFAIHGQRDIPKAIALSQFLTDNFGVLPGKVGVSVQPYHGNAGRVRMRIIRQPAK